MYRNGGMKESNPRIICPVLQFQEKSGFSTIIRTVLWIRVFPLVRLTIVRYVACFIFYQTGKIYQNYPHENGDEKNYLKTFVEISRAFIKKPENPSSGKKFLCKRLACKKVGAVRFGYIPCSTECQQEGIVE